MSDKPLPESDYLEPVTPTKPLLQRVMPYIRRLLRFKWNLAALPFTILQGALIATLGWSLFVGLPSWWERYQEEKELYAYYFDNYYQFYKKNKRDDFSAHKMADHYARFYAEYYTSDAYKDAVSSALPPASDKVAVSYNKNAVNAAGRTNELGVSLIKHFEGYRSEPYLDAVGKLTVGYGHLVRKGEIFTDTSKPAMEALLKEDMGVAEAVVKRYVKVPLNSNQFSALVSLVYNIGIGAFKDSTLLAKLNKGDYATAAREFLRWDYAGGDRLRGLTKRREAEKRLFES